MRSKLGFFAPLIAFVIGFGLLAISTLFYPTINNQAAAAKNAIGSATLSHYWGVSWALDSTRLILFVSGLLIVLVGVLIIWVKRHWRIE